MRRIVIVVGALAFAGCTVEVQQPAQVQQHVDAGCVGGWAYSEPFDCNGDGVVEPQYPEAGECPLTGVWMGFVPKCGEFGVLITGCTKDSTVGKDVVQGCR